jgi:hypothetical protein
MREILLKTKNKASESPIGIMDPINIQVNGKMGINTEMEFGKILMVISILDNGSTEKWRVLVFIQLLMVRNIKAILLTF